MLQSITVRLADTSCLLGVEAPSLIDLLARTPPAEVGQRARGVALAALFRLQSLDGGSLRALPGLRVGDDILVDDARLQFAHPEMSLVSALG